MIIHSDKKHQRRMAIRDAKANLIMAEQYVNAPYMRASLPAYNNSPIFIHEHMMKFHGEEA